MSRKQNVIQEEIKNVYRIIEDYFFNKHKLCSIDEITKESNISKSRCKKILDCLLSAKKIRVIYEGRGKPTIYVPAYLFEQMLWAQPKPEWVENYSFPEKLRKKEKMYELHNEIEHYEKIERLLYATNKPLEEAVAYSLKYLGFENVIHHKNNDLQDVSFESGGKKYLLEIEGTTKQGTKDKILQLYGWIRKEVDKGEDPENLVGVFVVNHYRLDDPENRGDPLTQHAKSYLKMHNFKFFTTVFLFNLVRGVIARKLTKKEAREVVINGEEYS